MVLLVNSSTARFGKFPISGPIPTEIGNLRNMAVLELTNNTMAGALPTQLGELSKLQELKLGNNSFTGSIPNEMKYMTSLSLIDLRKNSLTGSIPSEIGLMTNLTEIRLEGNDFTGTIPIEVTSLQQLRILTFDCDLLLEKRQDSESPIFFNECEDVKGNCIACRTENNLFRVLGASLW